jgi:elongation factor G
MDRTGADFFKVVAQIKEKLGATQFLSRSRLGLKKVLRALLTWFQIKHFIWEDDTLGKQYHEVPIPEDLKEVVKRIPYQTY